MAKVYSEELREGDFIQSTFLVATLDRRTSRDGRDYLRLVLNDRTGSLEGRVWEHVDMIASRLNVDDFAALRGEVTRFNGELHLEIHDAERVPDEDVSIRDFFPSSRWEGSDLVTQLNKLVEDKVQSAQIRAVIATVITDPKIAGVFAHAPAAMKNHHAYLGGLVEHCLSMSRIAVRLCDHYDAYYPGMINRDLVIAGCILHDIGKCLELDASRTTRYSTDGRLIGHISIGATWIDDAARRCDPPPSPDLVRQLKHLVLSHHGRLEYGSPVKPQTAEALLLHEIDMIDSRMNLCWNLFNESPDDREFWTPYSRMLGGQLHVRGPSQWETRSLFGDADLVGPGAAREDAKRTTKPQNLDLFEGTNP